MEHYTDLAFRYIKMNRRRSLLTVLGVAVSVMFLYILLNLGLSYLQNYREYLRERSDYEIVLFPENEDQINEILQDARVKDGTVADYYRYDYYHPVTYENALFINTTNPYRMDGIFESLKAKYGVEGQLHQEMAVTYLQGEEGSFAHVMILIALLVSYIIAIFGVGLIRNSIQLGMLERIQDFGQLRCIGSTKRQMKGIIYLQGLILELAQLRVLGASRREVFRIVMLEGVLEAVISCLLGVLLGAGVSLGIFYGIFIYFEAVEYVFPWAASVLSVAAVTLILCGAVYGPLKRMPNDVAQDLTTGADS